MDGFQDIAAVTAAPAGVDGAVGVEKARWFVAVVGNRAELAAADRLSAAGHECYVASQMETHIWKNGRKAKVRRVVIPAAVFIRCTERARREIVNLPFIKRFMTDRAAGQRRKPAVVPEGQIATLRFMLGNSDSPVTVSAATLERGDSVRVIRGSLRGLVGEIIDSEDGRSELIVRMDFFGCARVSIDRVNVEPA